MEGVSAVLNVMTLPPGATNTQARLVLDGVRGAIFEYQAGGPVGALVSSWARTAGTDPYGNPYPAGFSAGSGSSFSGTDFVINSNGVFFYTGPPATSPLYATITNTSGVDPYGHSYVDGITIYNGTAKVQFHVNASVGAPAVELPTGVAMETGHASVYAYAPGSGGSQLIELYIQGPSGPDGNSVFAALTSETDSGSTIATGALGYNGSALLNWTTHGVAVRDTAGNPYDVARLSLVTANPLNQTINSTSTAVIGNVGQAMSAPVIAGGSYELEAVIQWSANIAASTADFGFTGPALANGWASALFMENNTGTTYVGMQTTGIAFFNSNTMQIAQEMTTIIHGYAQFSAAGTISLVAKCGNAADTFVIINAKMTIKPMTQT